MAYKTFKQYVKEQYENLSGEELEKAIQSGKVAWEEGGEMPQVSARVGISGALDEIKKDISGLKMRIGKVEYRLGIQPEPPLATPGVGSVSPPPGSEQPMPGLPPTGEAI